MPRCKKERCCRRFHNEVIYKPIAVPLKELSEIVIDLDEFEAMRLCDVEELEQADAGERMGVSRGTIQRLLASGRKKLVSAFIQSAAIRIQNTPDKTKEE